MTAHNSTFTCAAKDDANTQWNFCPNVAPAYLYSVLFAGTLVAHIAQSVIYRKGYSWVIAMGALWETLCYVFRILSINQPTKSAWYIAWFLLILVNHIHGRTTLALLLLTGQ